jgi:hypothetical protein
VIPRAHWNEIARKLSLAEALPAPSLVGDSAAPAEQEPRGSAISQEPDVWLTPAQALYFLVMGGDNLVEIARLPHDVVIGALMRIQSVAVPLSPDAGPEERAAALKKVKNSSPRPVRTLIPARSSGATISLPRGWLPQKDGGHLSPFTNRQNRWNSAICGLPALTLRMQEETSFSTMSACRARVYGKRDTRRSHRTIWHPRSTPPRHFPISCHLTPYRNGPMLRWGGERYLSQIRYR